MENSRQPTDWAEDLLRDVIHGGLDVGVRLLGGRAVQYHAAGKVPQPLLRQPGDVDLFINGSQRRRVQQWLEAKGLVPDKEFNLLHGRHRLIYWYGREKIDVFIDAFQMCHRIDFAHRLELQPVTLPLADLALTKLQIVEFTEKDIKDTLALLLASDWAERDEPGVFNVARFAEVLAGDWGLWKTVTTNLRVLEGHAESLLQGDAPALAQVRDRVRRLREAANARRKSWRWRLRAVIGERVRWYELPEEP